LLVVGLVGMVTFGSMTLYEGDSLKAFVLESWELIPEGFWVSLLWTLIRIAVLITVMRYLLKYIYKWLDRQQEKTLAKKRYNVYNVENDPRRVLGLFVMDTYTYCRAHYSHALSIEVYL